MSWSLGRALRPALVYAVLLIVVQTTTGVLAAPSPFATTYTRSASCAGLSFYPIGSQNAYGAAGTLRLTDGAGSYFLCDPGLPSGASVTRVHFTLSDTSAGESVTDCALVRGHLAASSAEIADTLASVPATSGTPGTVRLSTSTISHGTIDNTRYGYWLQCLLTGAGVGLFGADVTYRISSTRG